MQFVAQENTDIHYNNPASATRQTLQELPVQNNTQNTAQHTGANKEVIDLDDGLRDELNSTPYANDIQYEQMTKALDSENLESDIRAQNRNIKVGSSI